MSKAPPKHILIHITTYKKRKPDSEDCEKMDKVCEKRKDKNEGSGRFICSICLNSKSLEDHKQENDNRKSRSCPICHKQCNVCSETEKNLKDKGNEQKTARNKDKYTTKKVQTADHSFELLNEVLTVFQNKKQFDNSKSSHKPDVSKSSTLIYKDVCVGTESFIDFKVKNKDYKFRLTKSKTVQYSIEDEKKEENKRFFVISSCQPQVIKRNNYKINLPDTKSDSIPQMKVDELKKSLKEKVKSKDAIEEVNRMFATVKRLDSLDDTNRPLVRSGPRVLPVVKTRNHEHTHREFVSSQCQTRNVCKCCQCQTASYNLSGGDSFIKNECCHKDIHNDCEEKNKCVYMLCSHYENQHKKFKTECRRRSFTYTAEQMAKAIEAVKEGAKVLQGLERFASKFLQFLTTEP